MIVESSSALPEWIQYAAAFTVAVISGVAIRMGWSSATGKQPESQVALAGSVIDNRAVKQLIDTMDNAIDRISDLHDERIRWDKRQLEQTEELRTEIRELIKCIGKLTIERR